MEAHGNPMAHEFDPCIIQINTKHLLDVIFVHYKWTIYLYVYLHMYLYIYLYSCTYIYWIEWHLNI